MNPPLRRPWALSLGALLLLVPFSQTPSVRACRISVEGEVEGVMLETLERRIEMALQREVEIIFFEINSYGGRIDWAETIANAVDSTTGARKVAYIPNKAISAGAFIALSCDEIVMGPRATMGDCQPVILDFSGPPKPAGEKAESAFRKKMVSYATDERRNYPVALTRAMVSPQIEVLRVPGAEGMPHEFVERDDLYSWSEARLRELQLFDQTDPGRDLGGKRHFTALVDGEERELTVVCREGEILTISGEEALDYGFARFVAKDFEEVAKLYGIEPEEVAILPVLWWEGFVKILNSMPAKALLVVLGLVGIFLELKTPGLSVPGVLGVVCFVLVFYASHLAGLAQWIEIILFGVGLILIALEVFVIPGFGIAGISGIILAISSLILAFVSFSPIQAPQTLFPWVELRQAVTWISVAIGAFVVSLVVLARYLPKTPILGRIMHGTSLSAEEGYTTQVSEGDLLLGRKGVSRTVLRPAGKIEVDGKTYDAAAQGDFIEAGEKVTIISTSGNRIIVRKA